METETREVAEFKVGATIGRRYEICDHIGFGAMGLVLKVKDQALDNDILALKILYPHLMQDETLFARFMNEVIVARKLTHPNIVRTYDIGRDERGYYYISMEYVEGRNLESLIYDEQNPMSFNEIVRILCDVSKGLAHAHEGGIIHRDLKPQNVMLTADGKVKIADFGLAETIWMKKSLTKTGESVGTPSYMAPEQIQGEELDHRCDIYAFGIMAYEMVVKKRPFDDENWFKMAAQHILEPLPRFNVEESNIPQWYEDVVQRCAAKKRDERYQSMSEVTAVLEPVVNGAAPVPDFQPVAHVLPQEFEAAADRVSVKRAALLSGTLLGTLFLLLALVYLAAPKSFQRSIAFSVDRAVGLNRSSNIANFFQSAAVGDVAMVELFLSYGTDVNVKDGNGDTALLLALRNGNTELGKLLIERYNADPNITDVDSVTPLMYAAAGNDPAMVDLLVRKSGDVNVKDSKGFRPLAYALRQGNPDSVRVLLNHSAPRGELNQVGPDGLTPLQRAVREEKIGIIELLLMQADVDVNKTDPDGDTPLTFAVKKENIAVVRLLVRSERLNLDQGNQRDAVRNAVERSTQNSKAEEIRDLLKPLSDRETKTLLPPSGFSSTQNSASLPKVAKSAIVVRPEPFRTGSIGVQYIRVRVKNTSPLTMEDVEVRYSHDGTRPKLSGPKQLLPNQEAAYTKNFIKSAPTLFTPIHVTCANCE